MEASRLNKILDQHRLWVKSNGMQGTEGRLINENLVRVNLTDADLRNIVLVCAKLMDADLTGANLTNADLRGADLNGANLQRADLSGADLNGADLKNTIVLPDVSWINPGCFAQLNRIRHNGFYLIKERKWVNFVQDSLGFFIQNNLEEGTFDILVGDRIIRGIPDWVKYTGLSKVKD